MGVSPQDAPRICTVKGAFPQYYLRQSEIIELLSRHLCQNWTDPESARRRLSSLQHSTRIEGRPLALSVPEYLELDSFRKANEAWIRVSAELCYKAAQQALDECKVSADEIDHVFFISSTGITTPSLDAKLINRLRLRPNVKRTPIFGLGCAGGAAGLARAADYLLGHPEEAALVIAVELCSLTLQRDDTSLANLIATTLFSDASAAALLVGASRGAYQGPSVIGTQSEFFYDTERVMGWDIVDSGFKIVMSSEIPDLVRRHFGQVANRFLERFGLDRNAIRHWIIHPGGPRVLEAVTCSLGLERNALERSWRLLAKFGNASSVSVLLVLADLMDSCEPRAGEYGLLAAMGPGFCSELVLLRW